MAETDPRELVFDGFGVSPGIGVGVAHIRESGLSAVTEYRIAPAQTDAEQARLRTAAARARSKISRLRNRMRKQAESGNGRGDGRDEIVYILDAYIQMLKDSRLVRGAVERIAQDSINAEAAVQAEVQAICESFHAMEDPYLAARVDDIREVGRRLLQQFGDPKQRVTTLLRKGSIIVADVLTPADAAQLDTDRVVGIATATGGRQSHTAIMARALGVPAVLGIPALIGAVTSGDRILIDGGLGRVVVNPTTETANAFRRRRNARSRERRRLGRLAKQPAVTRDGVAVALRANVELPVEMDAVADCGAAGVGLLRSEFLFVGRTVPPNEDEQFEILRAIVAKAEGHPVTIRTPDFGGDVALDMIAGEFGPSGSSMLGMRGIRLSLARPDLLETQFRAILRASAEGPIRILLPMVTSIAEVRAARDILTRAARGLHRRVANIPTALPPLGVMIETPAAALAASSLARVSDYFAIGSNDLTMYTLAIDRNDKWVAHLFDPLHPSVLHLIHHAAAAAQRARVPASVCGEMAGDPRLTGLLLGLGFRELSMAPASIPAVKHQILATDMTEAAPCAQTILTQSDPVRIQALLESLVAE